MIKAKLHRTHECFIMRIEGHAGYAASGSDIVCAAASMLCGALEQVLVQEKVDERCSYFSDIECGRFCAAFQAREGHEERVLAIYDTIAAGFMLLAHNYPDCVQFETD